MNLRDKLFSLFFCFVLIPQLSLPFNATTQAQPVLKTYVIDHAKDQKKAEKWAEKQYQPWQKKLSKEEEQSFKKLLDPVNEDKKENFHHINEQLKAYGGDLSARAVDIPEENGILTQHIQRIHAAINRKEGKLTKPLIVYKNETMEEIIHVDDAYFRTPNHKLNPKKLKQFRALFSAGLHSEFRIYDLFEDNKQTATVKWKITLPVGTPSGVITKNKIVIDKDSAFKVTNINTIVQKGIQLIRIEAKLVPKEEVENKIKLKTEKIKNEISTRLALSLDNKAIDFKLTGPSSDYSAHQLDEVMHKLLISIDNTILKQTLEFMMSKGGSLVFSNQEIYTLPMTYEPNQRTKAAVIEMLNTLGLYNLYNRNLLIHIPNNIQTESGILLHEFGHAVDNFGAHILQTASKELSLTFRFKRIFTKEKENLTKYGEINSREFFAEAFRMLHTPNESDTVKKKAPMTYAYLNEMLTAIIEETKCKS